ncbi:unnamed protein product [Paramecium pentaurelia]|uniref:Uncharacterized protein n=1 Tax=Paramecium pentaurelia TaxID=43138 RepID=A0A8S1SNW7_9CILI|nr:unnamed protein product [Paramecium pentaurelia]
MTQNLHQVQLISQRMIDRLQNFCNFQFTLHPQMTLEYNVVQMKVDLRNKNFKKIKIQNTSLVGENFVRCNLSRSEFSKVDINELNLNGAFLFNCKWKNIRVNELHKLKGHSSSINSICFSPDGITLASGSGERRGSGNCSIRLWDIKSRLQKKIRWSYQLCLLSLFLS